MTLILLPRQCRFYYCDDYFTASSRRSSCDATPILSWRRTEFTVTLPIYHCDLDFIVASYRSRCDGADLAAVVALCQTYFDGAGFAVASPMKFGYSYWLNFAVRPRVYFAALLPMKFNHVANARHYRACAGENFHACARKILKYRSIDHFMRCRTRCFISLSPTKFSRSLKR